MKEWNIINKKNITMIGDQKSDMEFAINAKIKFALFLNGNLFNFIKTLVSKKTLNFDEQSSNSYYWI